MPDRSSPQPAPNPRLRPFLKQAAAVIAAEKGLTPVALSKLEALARKWQLSDDELEQALSQLKSTSGDQENRYTQAFADFLAGELERMPGDVLSPQMEARARQIAAERFQLQPVQAETQIGKQCQAAGVSRIQPDAAQEYGRQLILQQLGDRVFADEDCCQSLLETGEAWGLDELAVDQIRLAQLAANRREQRRRQSPRWRPVVLLVLLLIALGGFAWVAYRTQPPPNADSDLPADDPSTEVVDPPLLSNLTPATRTALSQRLSGLAPGQVDALVEGIDHGSPEQLLEWIPNLVDVVLPAPATGPGDWQATVNVMTSLYTELPPEVAAAMAEKLAESLQSQPIPTIPAWKQQHRALDVVASLWQATASRSLQPHRDRLQQALPGVVAQPPVATSEHRRLVARQWTQLLAWSLEQPTEAAPLIQPLVQLSANYLSQEEIRPLREEALLSTLRAAPDRWAVLQRPINQAIQQSPPAGVVRWVELLLELPEGRWPVQLPTELETVTGLALASMPRTQARQQLQEYVDQQRRLRWEPLLDLVEQVDRQTQPVLEQPLVRDPLAEPTQIAQQALAVSLELACWWVVRDESQQQEQLRQRLQQMLEGRRADSSPLAPATRESGQLQRRQPTASDLRRRDAALHRLASQEDIPEDLRVLAVRQLQRVALRFDDVPYPQARAVARFLLSELTLESQLELQQMLASLGHWPNLLLAMSDELATATAPLDQSMTMVRRLVPGEIPQGDDGQQQQALRWHLTRGAHRLLAQRILRDPESLSSAWNRLAILLGQQYRLRWAGLPGGGGNPPSALPALALGTAAALHPERASLDVTEQQLQNLAQNPLDQISLAHQWACRGVIASVPRPELLEPIQDAYRRKLSQAETAGQRLSISQRLLLETLRQGRRQMLARRTGIGALAQVEEVVND